MSDNRNEELEIFTLQNMVTSPFFFLYIILNKIEVEEVNS